MFYTTSQSNSRMGLAGVLVAASLLLPTLAFALQGGEDPEDLPVVLEKKANHSGIHQLSAFYSTTAISKFVRSQGAYASYQYNFSELLGAELSGGFFTGHESAIAQGVRLQSAGEPSLSDLHRMRGMVNLGVAFVPFYGKISFGSEFDPAFDLVLLGGGGIAFTKRRLSAGGSDNNLVPAFHLGAGVRFYLSRLMALRFELRDYFYADPSPEHGGITWNLHFQAGLQFAFGAGDS